MKKLNPAQLGVLKLMAEGWELGVSSSAQGSRAWLQKEGLGKGGEVQSLSIATVHALRKRGFIVSLTEYGFPTGCNTLTDAGRKQVETGQELVDRLLREAPKDATLHTAYEGEHVG